MGVQCAPIRPRECPLYLWGGTPICVKLYSPVFQKVENAYRLLSYLEICYPMVQVMCKKRSVGCV